MNTTDHPDDESRLVATRFLKLSGAFILVCLIGLGAASLTSCAAFQAQRDVAALCAQLLDRNAGVTCVKAGYTAVNDAGETVLRRYEAGRLSISDARRALGVLESVYEAVELAEVAVLAGNLQDAETRLDVAIGLLDTLEALQ